MSSPVLQHFIEQHIPSINETLQQCLTELEAPPQLKRAMEYSLMAGGKRIRPIVLLAVLDALSTAVSKGMYAASAVEMIHTYSLIHDDLPAMDDDHYRRGKLTNHKVFGDAIAILAGDALLTHAFYLLTRPNEKELAPHIQVKMVRDLAFYAGGAGMVGGQAEDLLGETKALTFEQLSSIHRRKTGDLLICSARLGCYIGQATEQQLQHFTAYARHIGLAFQIQDDILDEIGDEHKMGKSQGSDRKKDKNTYVSILGLERAQTELNEQVNLAKAAVDKAGVKSKLLLELAEYMVSRDH